MTTYHDRIEQTTARREARAARLRAEADALHRRAGEMADVIPFGQPMMPDHYSYNRDRRYRDRIQRTMSRAIETDRAADRIETTATSTAILTTDSDAGEQLRRKIAELETAQEAMKRRNGIIRRTARAGADAQVAALVADGMTDTRARELLAPDFAGRVGYPAYALTNNNANLKRYRDRLAGLERVAAVTADAGGELADGISWGVDHDAGRVWIEFPGKPDETTRATLKRAGMRWAPSVGRWQRQATANGVAAVRRLVAGLGAAS